LVFGVFAHGPWTVHTRFETATHPVRGRFTCYSRAAMDGKALAVLVTVAFSAVGVLGDYFLKLASARDAPFRSAAFYVGFAVYASTAFGWLFVMKHLKLGTIGVLY